VAKARDALHNLDSWLEKYKEAAGFPTWGRVAAKAGVPPSTITAIREKGTMSVRVARLIAKALCPPDRNLREFTAELFAVANIDADRLGAESIADRVRRTRTIRAGYVVSEPFVMTPDPGQREPHGFAVELFADIAALLGATVDYAPAPIKLGEIASTLESGDCDVVVSAVLRTFARERVMSFSRPLPFLRVPLSAISRRSTDLEHLSVRGLVDWAARSRSDARLRAVRMLLVESEVGEEFFGAFIARSGHRPDVQRVRTLEPSVLLQQLLQRDVLIADMATCAAVMALDPAAVQAVKSDPEDAAIDAAFAHRDGDGGLSTLALYPISFGLPRHQDDWQAMIDGAMESLLLEGLRPLVYLYQRYLDDSSHLRRFVRADDEDVRSAQVRDIFRSVFERPITAAGAEPYRSPGLPRGVFSLPGNLHIHIDGGGDIAIVESLLQSAERSGAKGKINHIIDSVAGPQRARLPDTYASHTPGTGGVEHFEYFATLHGGTRETAVALLGELLPNVTRHPGLVVEVERVIGRVNAEGRLVYPELADVEKITMADVGIAPAPSLTFEIHHGFDVSGGGPVPALDDFARDVEALGISTGGWFRFAKGSAIAYRSNAFSDGTDLRAIVEREHAELQRYLDTHGIDARVRTVVEEVLGIWHAA
jgi:hypothetical protein